MSVSEQLDSVEREMRNIIERMREKDIEKVRIAFIKVVDQVEKANPATLAGIDVGNAIEARIPEVTFSSQPGPKGHRDFIIDLNDTEDDTHGLLG